jgi:hypothetical protein
MAATKTPTAGICDCCVFSSYSTIPAGGSENELLTASGLEVQIYIQSKKETEATSSKKAIFRYNSRSQELQCEIFHGSKKGNKVLYFGLADITAVEAGRGRANEAIVPEDTDEKLLFYIAVRNKGQLHLQMPDEVQTEHAIKCFKEIYMEELVKQA